MRRPLLFIVLLLTAQAAVAQWVQIARNEDLRLFIDRGDIRRSGDLATVWQMVDYTTAQWLGPTVIMSIRNEVEVECNGRRMRTIAASAYTEQMGRGRMVVSEKAPAPEWAAVPPGGSAEALWKIACGKE